MVNFVWVKPPKNWTPSTRVEAHDINGSVYDAASAVYNNFIKERGYQPDARIGLKHKPVGFSSTRWTFSVYPL
jgi:hypothetical protein